VRSGALRREEFISDQGTLGAQSMIELLLGVDFELGGELPPPAGVVAADIAALAIMLEPISQRGTI
jgi:hypothetical protein